VVISDAHHRLTVVIIITHRPRSCIAAHRRCSSLAALIRSG